MTECISVDEFNQRLLNAVVVPAVQEYSKKYDRWVLNNNNERVLADVHIVLTYTTLNFDGFYLTRQKLCVFSSLEDNDTAYLTESQSKLPEFEIDTLKFKVINGHNEELTNEDIFSLCAPFMPLVNPKPSSH